MSNTFALLAVLVVFSCTVGYGLSTFHAHVWTLLVFTVVALVSLQLSYVAGLLIKAFGS